MILGIIHININVTDIRRSVDFYQSLGFKVLHIFGDSAGSEVTTEPDIEEGMAVEGGRCRGAIMTLGEHPNCWTKIELIEWLEPPVETIPPASAYAQGVSRIAMRTKKLNTLVTEFQAAGIEFEQLPTEIDIVGARRFATFRDPDGVLLELIEF